MALTSKPHLFISYSWTTPEHEQWVIDLAEELTESGIHVVFDKWDLREGHDSIAFMEKMVGDADIKKVALICDRKYAEKANARSGGVGTEAQIVSPAIYNQSEQAKFVAVIAEKDENGKPYLPTYYQSRIFIDLVENEHRADNYEKLVRWIFDKPLHVRPEAGVPPSYVLEQNRGPSLGTSVLAKRVIDAVKGDKKHARGSLIEYFNNFSENLERLRVSAENRDSNYDWVINSIDNFTPYREEFIEVISTLTLYKTIDDFGAILQRFLEKILPYCERPESVTSWNEIDFDNFKFIVHEILLCAIGVLLRDDELPVVRDLLDATYFIPHRSRSSNNSADFTAFWNNLNSLEIRNQNGETRWHSPHGELLKNRFASSRISFRYIIQADFVLFLRSYLHQQDIMSYWWPVTLVYHSNHSSSFEIFTRATSRKYLEKVLPILGFESLQVLKSSLTKLVNDRRSLPQFGYNTYNPEKLINIETLGTRP